MNAPSSGSPLTEIPSSIVVNREPFSKVIVVNSEQFWKAFTSIVSTEAGISIEVIGQRRNVEYAIVFSLEPFSKVTVANLVQSPKASYLIVSTVAGISIAVIEQPAKAAPLDCFDTGRDFNRGNWTMPESLASNCFDTDRKFNGVKRSVGEGQLSNSS